MIKIEFPAHRTDIALAIGQALVAIGQGAPVEVKNAPPVNAQLQAYTQEYGEMDQERFGSADEIVSEGPETTTAPAGTVCDGVSFKGTVDEKGVTFNADMCGKAAKPFYASGKTAGQWKKRQGVDEADYNAWYAGELAKATPATAEVEVEQEQTFDAGSVWGQTKPQQEAACVKVTNVGELFTWISEMQAAGYFTTVDVDQAYAFNDLDMGKLWSATPDEQAKMVAALFNTLSAKVAA